jgi:NADH-quinone oxidoreductase subunit J
MMPDALTGLYVCLVLLAGGIYLLMPTQRPVVQRAKAACGLIVAGGLVGVGTYLMRWIGAGFEGRAFFVIFAVLAIAAAIRVVTHRRPVYSAVYFVLVVLATTGLCVLAAAEFLAATLVIVYGGAILVTYLFVIMLAQQGGEAPYDSRATEPFAAVIMGFALMAATTQAMVSTDPIARHAAEARHWLSRSVLADTPARAPVTGVKSAAFGSINPAEVNGPPGNVREIGRVLVRDHMIAVQVAGILMLLAMVGAIAMARKIIDPSERTPYELSQAERPPTTDVGKHVVPFATVEHPRVEHNESH